MRISDWMMSLEDCERLFGIKITLFRTSVLAIITVLECFRDHGEVALAFPPAAILGAVAVAGIGATAYGSYKAGKAADAASKKTQAEKDLESEVDSMVTGVDRADVEGMVDQATTPVAGAIAAGQTQTSQDILAAEGGGGAPSAIAGRAAALKTQLAQEGSGAVAQAALGAQQIAEQKGLLREEQKLAGREALAGLGRQRKNAALQGQLQQGAMWGNLGGSLLGGAASGASGAATNKLLA